MRWNRSGEYRLSDELSLSAKRTIVINKKQVLFVETGYVGQSMTMGNTNSLSRSIYLFARNGDITSAKGKAKVHHISIKETDILVYDFIPILDANNVPCMYDLVTGAYPYNHATVTFLYG